MNNWFLIKKPKRYNGKNKTSSVNGVDITEGWHVENADKSLFVAIYKTLVQVDERPQHRFRYTEPDRRESWK